MLPQGKRLIILRVEVGWIEDRSWWKQHSNSILKRWGWNRGKILLTGFALYLCSSSKPKQSGGCTLLAWKRKTGKKILNFGLETKTGPFVTWCMENMDNATQEFMRFTNPSLSCRVCCLSGSDSCGLAAEQCWYKLLPILNMRADKSASEEKGMGHLLQSWLNFPPPYSGELVQIMMATANENLSAKFCNRVLKFFTKLFQLSKWWLNPCCPAFLHFILFLC